MISPPLTLVERYSKLESSSSMVYFQLIHSIALNVFFSGTTGLTVYVNKKSTSKLLWILLQNFRRSFDYHISKYANFEFPFIYHASDYSHKSHPDENLYNKENSKKTNNLGRCLFYWYMPLTSSARSLLNCLPNIFSLHCLLALAFHEKSNKNETKERALCLVLPFIYI